MIFSGQLEVPAPRAQLWAILRDPARLAQALPGVNEVSIADERHFSAVARPLTALGETRVSMEFEVAEQREGEFVRIVGAGRSGENLISVDVSLSLSGDGEATDAAWRADVALRGVLASLLQRGIGELMREQIEGVLAAGAAISEAETGR
jgi:carbon monoxide dehydrogenase subunit G